MKYEIGMNRRKVFLVAGEGGHLEQARRFALTNSGYPNCIFVIVTDSNTDIISFDSEVVRMKNISELLKHKSLFNLAIFLPMFFIESLKVFLLLLLIRPKGIISFGPAFSTPFIFFARFLKIRSIFIETWSKFYEPSISGKVASLVAHKIYYQNITLKNKYKNGVYAGRL
jgi:beta-1,4-N-acetylglucosaminyltransferase